MNKDFKQGLKDGVPIGLGYFAVSFSLGIIAKKSGINFIEGFFASLFTSASAGEFAVFTLIGENAPYLSIIVMTLIANARYFLMSTSLCQRLSEDNPTWQRLLMGLGVTDEIYAISITKKDFTPYYFYGAMISAIVPWALGTSCGIIMGEILPELIVTALSVSLYGMFIAIIIPPCKTSKIITLVVIVTFIVSFLFSFVDSINSGTRTIIITVVLSSIFALLFPIKEEE